MSAHCPSFRLYLNGPRSFANFTGVRVEALTFDELGRRVVAWTRDKSAPARHVGIINAHNCALAIFDRTLREFYNSCDIAGPDSMPFVHWMRLFYRQQTDRIYGPDVLEYLFQIGSYHSLSFYFYGATDHVLKTMVSRIKRRHPELKIVGYIAPPFRPLSEEEDACIWSEIVRQSPDVICIGLGAPKQDYYIREHLDKINGSVLIGCGAAFDFISGQVKQAPRFIQRSGFEWLFRLLGQDFARLRTRYTHYYMVFLWNFLLQLMGLRKFNR